MQRNESPNGSAKRVGRLDIDTHGPSVLTMRALEGETMQGAEDGLLPLELGGMKIMPVGFLHYAATPKAAITRPIIGSITALD